MDWRNPVNSLDVNGDGFISPVDPLQVINELNLVGPHELGTQRPEVNPFWDASGDQFISPLDALQVINALNAGQIAPYELGEGQQIAAEQSITITVGQTAGTRTYRLQVTPTFVAANTPSSSQDLFAIYLVDPQQPGQTLLDRGTPGTTLFTLSATGAEFAPGRVRWDGEVVEIDLSAVTDRDTAVLQLQMLNGDGNRASTVIVKPLSNVVDAEGVASPVLLDSTTPSAAGAAFTLTGVPAVNDVAVRVENVRYNSATQHYLAELRLQNQGDSLGRSVAVAFPGLPSGVTLRNPSGTTAAGAPYINFAPAISRGGLSKNSRSERLLVEFDNPAGEVFTLSPQIFAGANQPPTLAAIAPLTVMPGDVLGTQLAATDPDGDRVTFSLRSTGSASASFPDLPTSMLRGNGALEFSPKPDQLGTYTFDVVASDGALESRRTVTLNVVADPLTTTRVSGKVLQVNGDPLAGMQVEVGAVQGLTMSDGSFTLDLGTGPLVSDTIKIRGELFTGSLVYPFIAEKLPLVLENDVIVGVNNVINRPIYLPALDTANGMTIDPMHDTMVTTAAIPGASVMVHAGTLMNQQGSPFTGVLSITEVPAGLTPAALPANLLPNLVVTIQPGEMVFATPAPITFPNRLAYPPGSMFDLWSIDPVTGQFTDVGDMKVSADGSSIETISGGIRTSSWHLPTPQIDPDELEDDTKPPNCPGDCERPFNSEVGLYSGTHLVTHELAGYQSQGESRGITLRYDSARAHPMGTVQFSYDVVAGQPNTAPTPPNIQNLITASLSLTNGDTHFQVAGGGIGEDSGDRHFWSTDGITIGNRIGAGLATDLSNLPTGLYGYELSTGFVRMSDSSSSATLTTIGGQLANVNTMDSPFGSGWGIAGLQEIVENGDGSVMLVDGDGGEYIFQSVAGQSTFQSPPSDFSKLEMLPDGKYRRTLTDGTIYDFNADNRLIKVRDRNQNETRYEYNAAGLLQSMIDPVNQTTTLTYIGGKITSITTPDGRSTTFTVDGTGNLTGVEEPDGSKQSWKYDGQHLLVGETDPNGNSSSTFYDEVGKVIRGVAADGAELRVQAASSRGVYSASRTSGTQAAPQADVRFASTPAAAMVQANGNVEAFSLTAGGRVEALRDKLGSRYAIARNDDELVAQFTNARGETFVYDYDASGRLIKTTDQVANTTTQGGSSGSGTGDGLTFPGRGFSVSSFPVDVTAADLNGDGHLDLITASSFNNNVSVLLSEGKGRYAAAVSFKAGDARSVAVADVNGDNHLDLITANSDSDNVAVLLGDGSGAFAAPVSFAAGDRPRSVALGDVNGDGRLDIVTANYGDNNISVLLGDGTGTFGGAVNFAVGMGPLSVALSDVNGDGRLDVVTANYGDDNISVLLGDGSGTFGGAVNFAVGKGPNSVALGDVNGDGHLDVVTADEADDNVSVLLGDGNGLFAASVTFAAGNSPQSVTLGDVNGDGHLDIVVANGDYFSTKVSLLVGDGSGAFAPGVNLMMGSDVQSVTLGDVNGDGILELIIANYGSGDVTVLTGKGDGTFVAAIDLVAGFNSRAIAVGDVNNDGRLDLVTGNGFRDNITVLLGNGLGAFAPAVNFSATGAYAAVALGDVNGDGNFDVVTSRSVLLGDGTGRFAAPVNFSVSADSVALGDVNGDNSLDIVTGRSVLLGDGSGAFLSAIAFTVEQVPDSMALGDLNGDGRLDIVVVSRYRNNASVLLGDGSGAYSAAVDFAVGKEPKSVALGDVNGDGRLDIVTANNSGDSVSVLLGDGSGAFAAAVNFRVGNDPQSVALGDVNGDGRLDIVVANSFLSNNVSVLLGDGSGAFAPAVNFAVGDGPFSVALGDLDDDDRLDIVTSNYYSSNVSVLLSRETTISGETTIRQSIRYDAAFGQPTQSVDGLGQVTDYDLDATTGNVLATHRPDGQAMHYTYTASGQVDLMTDANGHITDYDYDALGRLIRVTLAKGTPDASVTRYEYDGAGNITAMIDGNDHRTEYEFDGLNRMTLMRDPAGNTTSYKYDRTGNLIEMRDARGNKTTYAYDTRNRLIWTTDAQQNVTRFSYDRSGNLTTVTDPLGQVTRHRYDIRNRRIETTDPGGGVTQFRYDGDGNMILLIDPVGNRTSFFYDGRDRLIEERDSLGKKITYGYDAADNLVQKIDRDGRVTRYSYDSLNRLVNETWVDGGNEITYVYDPMGNLLNVVDSFSELTYTYDALDRVRSVDNAGTGGAPQVLLTYSYDAASNVTSVVDAINGAPGATTSYQYDARNLQTQITQTGSGVSSKQVDFTYNAVGQYEHLRRYSDLTATQLVIDTTYTYDTLNRIQAIDHRNSSGTDVSFFHYQYDAASRITQITDIDGLTTYGYDTRDQLTSADHAPAVAGLPTEPPDESYAYDANGNRIDSHLHGNGYVTGPGNRLLSDGTYNYVYDDEGNTKLRTEITTGNYREFHWDYRNRLTAVIDKLANGTATQEVRFTYDALDRRIAKSVDTTPEDAVDAVLTNFVYDREDVILDFVDTDGAGSVASRMFQRYFHGPDIDQIIAQDGDDVEWHLSDKVGTLRGLVNKDGGSQLKFDSFGNIVSAVEAESGTRFLFVGREWDSEIGMYYMRARFYDVATGRFLREDPLRGMEGDTNPFRYAINSPLTFTDPYGQDAVVIEKQFIHPKVLLDTSQGRVLIDFFPKYDSLGAIDGEGVVRITDSAMHRFVESGGDERLALSISEGDVVLAHAKKIQALARDGLYRYTLLNQNAVLHEILEDLLDDVIRERRRNCYGFVDDLLGTR